MDEKQTLIAELVAEVAETAATTGCKALSPRVLEALAKVRREAFVPPRERDLAYVNAPLPIESGQTISQPFIVAIMTELLDLDAKDVVLEIGTGSGYQAAVLAELVRQVYSVEVIPELAHSARQALIAQGYRNVEVRCSDGALGWPEHAPYDAIIVTAAAPEIPPELVRQLGPHGRMIVPVGERFESQRLVLIEKDVAGRVKQRDVLDVAFVPLVS